MAWRNRSAGLQVLGVSKLTPAQKLPQSFQLSAHFVQLRLQIRLIFLSLIDLFLHLEDGGVGWYLRWLTHERIRHARWRNIMMWKITLPNNSTLFVRLVHLQVNFILQLSRDGLWHASQLSINLLLQGDYKISLFIYKRKKAKRKGKHEPITL